MTNNVINSYNNLDCPFPNTLKVIVVHSLSEFVALLSDGRRIERSDLNDFAHELHRNGIKAESVHYDWRAGQRMMTAGQQAALSAAIRQHERHNSGLAIAA